MSEQDLAFFESELRTPELKQWSEIMSGSHADKPTKEETKVKIREKLEQLLSLLRVEKLEDTDKMKVKISVSSPRFLIRGYSSDDKPLFILEYTPHMLDPFGKSFKWYSRLKDCISDGTLHAIGHLLYQKDFYSLPDKYSLDLELPALSRDKLREYDERFVRLWNSM